MQISKKNSYIEILKLFFMFLIVASHWGWAFVNGEIPGGGGELCYSFYRVFRSLGQFGNVGFIFISGFYLFNSKSNIKKYL